MPNPWDSAPIIEPAPDKAATMPWASAPLVDAPAAPTTQQLQTKYAPQPTNFPQPTTYENWAHAAQQSLAKTGTGLLGLVAPQTANRLQQNVNLATPYNPQSVAGVAGEFTGMALPMVTGAGGAGAVATKALPLVLGASAAGGAREDIAQQRAQGQQIGGGQELADAALQGTIATLAGKVGMANLTGSLVKGVLAKAGIQAGDAAIQQALSNLAAQQTGVNPERGIMEGVAKAAGMGGALGLGAGATHNILEGMRAKVGQNVGTPEQVPTTGKQAELFPEPKQTQPELPFPEKQKAEAVNTEDLHAKDQAEIAALRERLHATDITQGEAAKLPAPFEPEKHGEMVNPTPEERRGDIATERRLAARDQNPTEYHRRLSDIEPSEAQRIERLASFESSQETMAGEKVKAEEAAKPKPYELAGPEPEKTPWMPYANPEKGLPLRGEGVKTPGREPYTTTTTERLFHKEVANRAEELAAQPPKFTEGENQPTAPGEFGTRNKAKETTPIEAPKQVPLKGDIAESLFPEGPKGATGKQLDLGTMKGVQAAREEGTYVETPKTPEERKGFVSNLLQKLGQNQSVNESLRSMKAVSEKDIHDSVTTLKPYKELAGKMSPEEKANWIDSVEATGKSPDPALQPAADLHRAINAGNIEKMKALGMEDKVADYNKNWIKFLARSEDNGGWVGGLQGKEGYQKLRESKNFAEFVDRAKAAGLKLPYDNVIDMMNAGHAEVARSLSFRDTIQNDWMKRDLARQIAPDEKPPEGWTVLPNRLATDPFVNPEGTKVIVPEGVAAKLENYTQNQARPGDPLSLGLNASRKLRFAADVFYSPRAMAGQAGWSIGRLLRGDIAGANPIKSWTTGRKALTTSADILRSDPATKPVADYLDRAVEHGFRSSAFEELPSPDANKEGMLNKMKAGANKVTGAVSKFLKTRLVEPLKAGAAIHSVEISDALADKYGWTPKEQAEFLTSQMKSIDRAFGSSGDVNTLPPGLSKVVNILSPTINYHTDAYRLFGQAAKETTTRGLRRSAMPEAVGQVLGTSLVSAIAMAAMTHAITGKTEWPQDVKDMFFPRTGRTEKDGTPQRLSLPGTLNPMAKDVVRLSQGRVSNAVGSWIDPVFTATAEAITNRDFKGKEIGNFGERVGHAVKGTAEPFFPDTSHGIEQFFEAIPGLRTAPKDIEHTAEQNEALYKQHHPTPRKPGHQ